MEPTRELIAAIDRSKVEHARQMTPMQRFRTGPELFDVWRRCVAGWVRSNQPDATEQDVRNEIKRRLRLARKMDELGSDPERPLYVDVKP